MGGGRLRRRAARRERRVERRRKVRLVVIPLLLLLLAGGVAAFLVTREDPGPLEADVGEDLSEGPLRAIFADFAGGDRMLREHLVEEDSVRDLLPLPRPGETHAAPGSPYVAVEWWEEGVPRITVMNPRTGEQQDIEGSGFDPIWHPTGTSLTYSEPVDVDRCTGEECPGDVRIHVYDAATAESEIIVEEGPWMPRFWVGDRVLFQDEDDNLIVHLEGRDGDRTTIDVWARGALGASPDGRWLFVSWEEETAFYPLDADGSFAGDPIRVDVPAREGLRIAAWSHDSSMLVGTAGGRADLLLLSPDDPEPVELADPRGMVTRLAWAPDNSHILVTAVAERFETSLCPADLEMAEEGCHRILAWTMGLTPLRVEGT